MVRDQFRAQSSNDGNYATIRGETSTEEATAQPRIAHRTIIDTYRMSHNRKQRLCIIYPVFGQLPTMRFETHHNSRGPRRGPGPGQRRAAA